MLHINRFGNHFQDYWVKFVIEMKYNYNISKYYSFFFITNSIFFNKHKLIINIVLTVCHTNEQIILSLSSSEL